MIHLNMYQYLSLEKIAIENVRSCLFCCLYLLPLYLMPESSFSSKVCNGGISLPGLYKKEYFHHKSRQLLMINDRILPFHNTVLFLVKSNLSPLSPYTFQQLTSCPHLYSHFCASHQGFGVSS